MILLGIGRWVLRKFQINFAYYTITVYIGGGPNKSVIYIF